MKFRDIKKRSDVRIYQNNLFLAVTDMFVDMVTQAAISPSEARRLVMRDTKIFIDGAAKELKK